MTLDTLFSTKFEKAMKTVPVTVKADVQGSVEALSGSLLKSMAYVDIIHTAAGAINESDVTFGISVRRHYYWLHHKATPLAKRLPDKVLTFASTTSFITQLMIQLFS